MFSLFQKSKWQYRELLIRTLGKNDRNLIQTGLNIKGICLLGSRASQAVQILDLMIMVSRSSPHSKKFVPPTLFLSSYGQFRLHFFVTYNLKIKEYFSLQPWQESEVLRETLSVFSHVLVPEVDMWTRVVGTLTRPGFLVSADQRNLLKEGILVKEPVSATRMGQKQKDSQELVDQLEGSYVAQKMTEWVSSRSV